MRCGAWCLQQQLGLLHGTSTVTLLLRISPEMFVVPAREGGDGYPEQSSVEFILSDTQATTGPELRRRWKHVRLSTRL